MHCLEISLWFFVGKTNIYFNPEGISGAFSGKIPINFFASIPEEIPVRISVDDFCRNSWKSFRSRNF